MSTKRTGPKPRLDGRTSQIVRIAANESEARLIRDRLSPDQRRRILLVGIAAQDKIVNRDDAVLIDHPRGKAVLFK